MREDWQTWQTRQTLIERIKDKANTEDWEKFTNFYEPYVKGFLYRLGMKSDQVDDFSQITKS